MTFDSASFSAFSALIESKCCLLPLQAAPHPATLTIWLPYQLPFFPKIWWHSWIGSPVISPLERKCRRGPGSRPLKILNRGGMPQWQEIFMVRNTVTASLERQTIYFSKRRWLVRGVGGCNIDAMFRELMIAKYHPALQPHRVWDSAILWFLSLGIK